MPRPGGESGKLGDQYEGDWTVDQLIDLCLGRATEICVEEVGIEAGGVEFRLRNMGGTNLFHSVKRQRAEGEWSLAELTTPGSNGRSILGDLFKILQADATAKCVFVSGTGANDLREACEVAAKCTTAHEFDRLMQGMSPLKRKLSERIVDKNALASWSEVHGLLSRIQIVLKDPLSLRHDVEERLFAWFAKSDLAPYNVADERRALADFVVSKLGVPLTADDVLVLLSSRGIVRRDALAQPDVRNKVDESVKHYLRVVNGDLVNRTAIPRIEADAAIEQLTKSEDSQGVLLSGSAGYGKSCVLAQIVSQLQKHSPLFVVRLDEADNVRTTVELGKGLGFDRSPVSVLAGLAGNRPCVFVVDQLDAVSELSGRKSTLWDIFERLRTEAARFPNMKFLIACRSFDLEHDHRLRRLAAKESGFKHIELELLTIARVDEVLNASGIGAATVSAREKELLRVPLQLHLFLISYEPGQKPIATRQDLFDRFWASKQVAARNRCVGACHWQDVIDALVKNMSTRAALTAVDDVVAAWTNTVDAMTSEHVLVRDARRIRFFHESFVDYAFARGFAARGESLVEFLIKTDQGLFYRSLVRQVLTHLRDDDRKAFLHTLQSLMKDGRIRFHLKVLVLDWMSSLIDPTEDEWRIVEELTSGPEIGDRAFWVIRNSTGWFDLLDGLGIPTNWITSPIEEWRNRAIWLLRATQIREQRSVVIARLLRLWANDAQRRGELLSTVVEQDVWRCEELKELFLELLPELIDLPSQPRRHHDWWDAVHDAVKHDPAFVLKCVTTWLDRLIATWKPESKHDRFLDRDDTSQSAPIALSELAKASPLDFTEALLPRISQIVRLTAYAHNEGLIGDATWHTRAASDFHGMDGGLLECTILGLELLAQLSPDSLEKLIASFPKSDFETEIYILLRAWMSQPERNAAAILSLFCERPETFDIGYNVWSKGEPTYAVSREAIGKCAPYWTDAHIARLEQAILDFVPWPTATERQTDWHRHLLLSAIPLDRLSESGRKSWESLHLKFPEADLRLPTRSDSGFVGSPIEPEDASKFSNEQWLEAMRKHDTGWSEPRRHGEGTAVELSRVLQQQVEHDPERFAALASQMDDGINPLYFSAILSGIAPLNRPSKDSNVTLVSPDTFKAVIRRTHLLPDKTCGKEICHAFSYLSESEIESDLMDILEYYATLATDPTEDVWMKEAPSGAKYNGGDAHMSGFNSVRGSAARTIGHLLYDRRELLERFLPVLERLVSDPILCVRTCAIEALLPLLNFERETAVRLFVKACEGATPILGSRPVDRFYYWASNTHYEALRPTLLLALHSGDKEAVDSAARQICLASFSVPAAEVDAAGVVGGTDTMRKAAANVFASNVRIPFCRDRCLRLLPQFFHDPVDEVRDVAARCWHVFTREDLIRDEPLIESYIESDSFPTRHDYLIRRLEETHAPLPKVIVKAAERFLSVVKAHAGDSPHPAVYESSTIATLIVRLYAQTNDATLRVKCLDLIDEMAQLRMDVDQHLADHDR